MKHNSLSVIRSDLQKFENQYSRVALVVSSSFQQCLYLDSTDEIETLMGFEIIPFFSVV